MNFTTKTFLVVTGVAFLSLPGLYAQRGGHGGGRGAAVGSRAAFAGRPTFGANSATGSRLTANSAFRSGRFTGARSSRPGYYGRGGGHGGGYRGHGHHHYGRYYYLGGIPYFYPFYGYGFGYPSYYYGGFYGDGFAGGYDGGYPGGAYEGRVSSSRGVEDDGDRDEAPQQTGNSLPSAVQRQLAKRGYYKGSVDGQFGPASRDALGRFQKSQGLKPSGKIDEDTLDKLGFTDDR